MNLFYEDLPKDKYGFVDLDEIVVHEKVKSSQSKPVTNFYYDNTMYWFKGYPIKENSDKQAILATGEEEMINELVNQEFAKIFGFGVVDYALAKVNGTLGLVSINCHEKYPGSEMFNSVVCQNRSLYNKKDFPHHIKFYKTLADAKVISQVQLKKVQLASLMQFGLGLFDNHDENAYFYTDPENQDKDNVILIDLESTWGCGYESLKSLKKALKQNQLLVDLGVLHESENIENFLKNLTTQPCVTKKIMEDYLNKITNLLKGNSVYKHINETIESEYGLPIPKPYIEKLKTVLSYTTKSLEKAYAKKAEDMEQI